MRQRWKDGAWIRINDIGRVVRIGIGLLLLISAAFKIHWHINSPALPQSGWLESSAVIYPASAFELCLGGLLMVGAWSPVIRWVSIFTFGVFFCVALAETFGGFKSCGCFGGGVHIHPWIMTAFDSSCTILLLRCTAQSRSDIFFGLSKIKATIVLGVITTTMATAAIWAVRRPPFVLAQSRNVAGDADSFGLPGSLVLLDPDKLAGKPFLLTSHIDIGSQVKQGSWIILLVHHDCDECAGAVPKYQAASSTTDSPKLAIIEMPPYGSPLNSATWPTSIGLFGKLDTSRDWFATTPLAILLKDGKVRAATDGGNAATPNPAWNRLLSGALDNGN